MDGIPAVLDSVSGVDATMDIASCSDMVMMMMADPSNKVTMLEWTPQISAVPDLASSAVPLLDPESTTR